MTDRAEPSCLIGGDAQWDAIAEGCVKGHSGAEVVYIQHADDLMPSLDLTYTNELPVSAEQEIVTGDCNADNYGDYLSEESESRSPAEHIFQEPSEATFEHNTVIVHEEEPLQQSEEVPTLDVEQEVMMSDVGVQEEVILQSNGQESVDGCDFYISQNGEIDIKEEEIGDMNQTEEEVPVVHQHEDIFGASLAEDEEEVVYSEDKTSSDTEMSVAMDLANLSRGTLPADRSSSYSSNNCENVMPLIMHPSCGEEKPRLSYAQMIAESLMNSPDRMLTLSEIYAYIHRKYPYYRMEVKSWQNAIRRSLTLNTAFTKVPRPNNEGRGNFWRMEEGSERTIFRRALKNHHYNRGKVGNSVPNRARSVVKTAGGSMPISPILETASLVEQAEEQFIIGEDGQLEAAPTQKIVFASSTSPTPTPTSINTTAVGTTQRVIRVIQPNAANSFTSTSATTTTTSSPRILRLAGSNNGSNPSKVIQLSGSGSATGTKILRVSSSGGSGINTLSPSTTAKVLKLANGKQFSIPSGQIVFIALPKKEEKV